jgi:hypothetical protein
MGRIKVFGPIVAFMTVLGAAAFGSEGKMSLSVRVGIPTDVLFKLGRMYSFGLAVEGAAGVQVTDWLILGGVGGYGFGKGVSEDMPDATHYLWAAARVGFGSLAGFSASLIGGVIAVPFGDPPFIPDLGISLDWKFLSLGLSVGSVSLGVSLVF